MKQITVRLNEELDRIAEDSGRSRAEVIRDELNSLEDTSEVLLTSVERILPKTQRECLGGCPPG